MRFIFGVIIGCLLTVGIAWFHDLDIDTTQPGAEARRFVNWEVVDTNVHQFTASLREEWDRLTDRRG